MKTLLRVLIVAVLAGNTVSITCMESNSSLTKNIQYRLYSEKIATIDKENEKKINNFIEYGYLNNPARAMENIQNKLTRFEKKIAEREEDFLLRIKNTYKISDDDWARGMHYSCLFDEFRAKEKHIPLSNAVHDDNLPLYFVAMLKKQLSERGYNFKRFNLKNNGGERHSFSMANVSLKIVSDVPEATEPGLIGICYDHIHNVSLKAKEGCCIYLVNGAIREKSGFLYILLYVCGVNILRREEDFYVDLTVNLSAFRAALKSARKAKLLKQFFKESCVSEFSIENYKDLSKINRLHECLAWLQEYSSYVG